MSAIPAAILAAIRQGVPADPSGTQVREGLPYLQPVDAVCPFCDGPMVTWDGADTIACLPCETDALTDRGRR